MCKKSNLRQNSSRDSSRGSSIDRARSYERKDSRNSDRRDRREFRDRRTPTRNSDRRKNSPDDKLTPLYQKHGESFLVWCSFIAKVPGCWGSPVSKTLGSLKISNLLNFPVSKAIRSHQDSPVYFLHGGIYFFVSPNFKPSPKFSRDIHSKRGLVF